MGRAYSEDLRNRVMSAYDSGEKQCSIAERFSISEKTLYLWRHQREERGHIRPITKYQSGHSHKIKDLERFKEFAIKNSYMTNTEMAIAWGNVGRTTINKHLKLIGFTRKKNFWLYKS